MTSTTDPTDISDADLEAFAKGSGFAHVAKSKSGEARTMYERMVRWQQMKLLIDPIRGTDASATIKRIDDDSNEEKKAGKRSCAAVTAPRFSLDPVSSPASGV